MKYNIWIHEARLQHLQKYVSDIKVLGNDKDLVNVELEIKYDMDLMDIFTAGAQYGIDSMAKTWRAAI
jgi:hypothetical protein